MLCLKRIQGLPVILAVFTMLLVTGCDFMFPDQFEERAFTLPESMQAACEMMREPLESIAHVPLNITGIDSILGAENVSGRDGDQIIIQRFTDMVDEIEALTVNALNVIYYPAGEDTAVAALKLDAAAQLAFYSSWEFTQTNINTYIEVNVFNADGRIEPIDEAIAPEIVSYCTKSYRLESGGSVYRCAVRGFQVHDLDAGAYILRFVIPDPDEPGPFRLAVLP